MFGGPCRTGLKKARRGVKFNLEIPEISGCRFAILHVADGVDVGAGLEDYACDYSLEVGVYD